MHTKKNDKQKIMKRTLFILITLLIAMTHQAQNKQSMNDNNYTNLWQKVDDAEKKSLPKSASDVVNKKVMSL